MGPRMDSGAKMMYHGANAHVAVKRGCPTAAEMNIIALRDDPVVIEKIPRHLTLGPGFA